MTTSQIIKTVVEFLLLGAVVLTYIFENKLIAFENKIKARFGGDPKK